MSKIFSILLTLLMAFCVSRALESQPTAAQTAIESPRLLALGGQLKAGNAAALDEFWREVKQRGTPLVESITGDDKDVLVTFLWRGGSETKNVILFSDTIPWTCASFANSLDELLRSRLLNLSGSDVYFKTCKLRRDGRFTYYLAPNDSLLLRHERKDWNMLQPDPLNPHRFVLRFEKQEWVSSAVELPGAPHAAWAEQRSDVPKGRTQEYRLNSKVLGEERRYWIYTPPGYSTSGKPYPLLVLFDGWDYTRIVPTATIVDNLIAAQRIPRLVVLSVDQKKRMAELTCNDSFDDFLVRELIPWVRAHYHVSSNPAETTIGGESAGGLGAAFAGLRHPEVFGNVLSLFGYFSWEPGEHNIGGDAEGDLGEWEWIIHQYAETPKLPLRFVIIAGLFDYGGELSPRPTMLASNRHMRDVLLARGYPIVYREIAAGDALFCALTALPDGLQAALGREGPQQ